MFESGRGPITVRGKAFIEEPNTNVKGRKGGKGKAKAGSSAGASSKPLVVITELPYQTNKAGFVANVASLVEAGKLTGGSHQSPDQYQRCRMVSLACMLAFHCISGCTGPMCSATDLSCMQPMLLKYSGNFWHDLCIAGCYPRF